MRFLHDKNCVSSGLDLDKLSVNTYRLRRVALVTVEPRKGGGGLCICKGRAFANGKGNIEIYFKILEKEGG